MKTPGVYIVEKNAFPNSTVEAATAVPVFIGYTEKALNGIESLINKPFKISSVGEFCAHFGGAPMPKFKISLQDIPADQDTKTDSNEGKDPVPLTDMELLKKLTLKIGQQTFLIEDDSRFSLYYHILLFYANGGGPCYIVSVGDYSVESLSVAAFNGAFEPLSKEYEPTMVVIPEAVNLSLDDCHSLQQQMLKHCGLDMRNRFAILDIHINKYADLTAAVIDNITPFREGIGSNQLAYGAAYYPWLCTSILSEGDITYDNLEWKDMSTILKGYNDTKLMTLEAFVSANNKLITDGKKTLKGNEGKDVEIPLSAAEIQQLKTDTHQALFQNWNVYQRVVIRIKELLNLLPPSAAMAGLYTMVDQSRGVWKAPANISINSVVKPYENITNSQQEDLNVPMNGKAINAIRAFPGDGVKVWGARTLDGNSLDWRYINVRRTMIFLEESIKNAARAYVFEPNDSNTWIMIKCMIENFLKGIWKRGGLAGVVAEDAFSVHIGLGDTMTPEDILEGIMRITILVAISHPAEFIEITFQQQMQKS